MFVSASSSSRVGNWVSQGPLSVFLGWLCVAEPLRGDTRNTRALSAASTLLMQRLSAAPLNFRRGVGIRKSEAGTAL